jgi:predicted nucleic acid-binding protein
MIRVVIDTKVLVSATISLSGSGVKYARTDISQSLYDSLR